MPVTFTINNHPVESVQLQPKETSKAFVADIRRRIDPRLPPKHAENTHLLSSSLKEADLPYIIPAKNGFLEACILAYKKHHHLVIRPDDVWISIVAGLSLYLKEHAAELRNQFTPPSSRKKLSLRTSGSSWAVDFAFLTQVFTNLLVDNLRDKELKRWVVPGFSTTTRTDVLCTSVIMNGALQSVSSYEEMSLCGITSVTLKGKKSDYEKIFTRLDKLSEWGDQTHYWAELLRPIIRRFVSAFDGEPDLPFWNCICYSTIDQCGDEQFTGWITAFCPFDENGKWQLFTPVMPENIGHLQIDQVIYPAVYAHKIPWGYSQLEFQVIEDGKPVDVVCIAGLIGQKVTDGEMEEHPAGLGFLSNAHNTTINILPGYFIFEKPVWVPNAVQYPEEYKQLHQYLHQLNSLETSLSTGVPVLHTSSASPIDKAFDKNHSSDKLKPINASPMHGPRSITNSSTSDGRTSPRKLQKMRPRSVERLAEGPIEAAPNFAWRGVISRRSRSPPPGFATRV